MTAMSLPTKLFHLLLIFAILTVATQAIHDPAYTGIKTRTYQRDPIIEKAFKQQTQQPPQHQYYGQNYHHTEIVENNERLSPIYSSNNNNNNNDNKYISNNQQPHLEGSSYYHPHQQQQQPQQQHEQQQELPLYERSSHNTQERHAAQQKGGGSNWNDAENTITEYYTGCPPHYTGLLAYAYDCRRFVNCWNGRGHIQSCGPGTVFNSVTLECDRPDKVVCGTLAALGDSQAPHTSKYRAGRLLNVAIENVDVLCPLGVTGLHPHPSDCTKFLNCANGNVHIQDCGPGTAYSIPLMVCDYKHKVDCSGRESGAVDVDVSASRGVVYGHADSHNTYDYNNYRDSKAYVHGGTNSYQHGYQGTGVNGNSWVYTQHGTGEINSANNQYGTGDNNQHGKNYYGQNTSGDDRWTNMDRQRPDANSPNKFGDGSTSWINQGQHTTNEYGGTIHDTELDSSWSGQGLSVNRQTPTEHVIYEEGSLQPNRNYAHTTNLYTPPLAPLTPISTTTTTNIYYAQPVGSQEDSEETFSNVYGGDLSPTAPGTPFNPAPSTYQNRENYSREIDYSNKWKPIYNRPIPNSVALPNPNLIPPHHDNTSYNHTTTYINTPTSLLMAPFSTNADAGQKPVEESDDKISFHDQYPSESRNVNSGSVDVTNLYGGLQPPPLSSSYPNKPTQQIYPNHRTTYSETTPTNRAEESNLFGGLKPPIFTTSTQETKTAKNHLYPPTYPTVSLSASNLQPSNSHHINNDRAHRMHSSLSNATISKSPIDPHYSPSYASVAHSKNTTWSNVGRIYPQHATSDSTIAYDRKGAFPPAYNRQYYTSPSSFSPDEEKITGTSSELPISDAIRMLLRPYFNRSGTVNEDTAEKAESHIMKLVTPHHTTTQNTSSTLPTITAPDDDVELLIAGEQHHMVTIIKNGTREVTSEFHANQENSRKEDEQSNWHKHEHEHNRDFHLRHPNIPNPFTETEPSSVNPNYHQQHHTNQHHNHSNHEHSRDFHLRHPDVPNPFETLNVGNTAKSKVMYDLQNPNAESTTAYNYAINLRNSIGANDDCQFDCGNGKCVKSFEVCDGVNNCGNRKDESQCSHLGYEVRLTAGDSVNMGRVEVKILGKWGYICDDKFGLRDADVVCRELGFNLGASEVRGNSYYPSEDVNFSFMMDEVDCRGNETSLKDCEFKGWGVNNCGPDEIVGVVCKVPLLKCPNNYWLCSTSKECIPPAFVCDNTPDCADKSDESEQVCNSPIEYRLEGGRSTAEGRLEVKYRNEWGTVCDDDFGLKEAQIVCNSLGYYGKPTIKKNIFGPGNGPIWLDQVSCIGNETSIDKCTHWSWGEHNCNHTEDVGLQCTAGPPPRKTASTSNGGQYALEDNQSVLEDIGLYPGQWERASKAITIQRRCGHFKDNLIDEYEHPEERVVNGTVAKRGRHPWQATIRTRGRGGISSHWCGAVLISKRHLLTAAHCLAGYPKGAYFIRMGDHYANIAEASEIDGYIENWYIHEKFRDQTHMNNDIALIVLKQPVRFNDYVQPICLPEKNTPLKENRMCTISGWGSVKSGVSTPSNILRAAQIPILADDTCKQAHVYGSSMTEGMFCAGFMDESVDACDGDSGGPLICSDNDGETLYGIISWGQHCGYANKPGVYVRVEKYIDWIYEKINYSIQQSAS